MATKSKSSRTLSCSTSAARATRFADTTSDAAPVAAAVASTFGSPRARELQKALRSGADEPSAAAHAAAGAAETPVAAAAPETGDSANDNRGRLLERLKSYGEA